MSTDPLEQIKLDISAKFAQAQDELEKQSAALRARQEDLETEVSNSRVSMLKERQEMLAAVDKERQERLAEIEQAQTELSEQQAAFEVEKSVVSAANIEFEKKIKLDVGGAHYTTTRATLCSVPGSMLEAMFSGRFPIKLDADERAFIDRDGQTFREVLNVLRSPHAYTWDPDAKAAADLRVELEYFGLANVDRVPTVLPALSEEHCLHRVSGLRIVLQAKRPVTIDGFRSFFQNDVHGKRLRVYVKQGDFRDARVAVDEADWTLAHTSFLQPDTTGGSQLKKLCVGLGVRIEPGWHTFYLHYELRGAIPRKEAKSPIAMGGPSVSADEEDCQTIASDGVLEVYRGCNTNSPIPFDNPNSTCFGFVGEVHYKEF